MGDTKQPFCLQSCVKPLQYAIAVHEAGTENVHRYVGKEPSGLKFNMLSLDEEGVRGLFTGDFFLKKQFLVSAYEVEIVLLAVLYDNDIKTFLI